MDETLEASARRELREETGLEVETLEQLHTFGDPGRDPRGRAISIVFWTALKIPPPGTQVGDDAAHLAWHPLDHLPALAFDHTQVLEMLASRLKPPPRRRKKGERGASAP